MEITILIFSVIILIILIFTCLFVVGVLTKLVEIEKNMVSTSILINKIYNDQSAIIQNLIKITQNTESLSNYILSDFGLEDPSNLISPSDEEIIGLLQQNNLELTQNDINEFKRIFKEEKENNRDNTDINGVS